MSDGLARFEFVDRLLKRFGDLPSFGLALQPRRQAFKPSLPVMLEALVRFTASWVDLPAEILFCLFDLGD